MALQGRMWTERVIIIDKPIQYLFKDFSSVSCKINLEVFKIFHKFITFVDLYYGRLTFLPYDLFVHFPCFFNHVMLEIINTNIIHFLKTK